ncbi:hypothetical protein H5410_000645 [Solanum commersonii]|uniref:Uncharacterized protein n=1 Tax=Solanum commersonii TaxID=4109 RepID=A0A9J6AWT5_SOLCO|nr:hypothetical protein H5410_000645 [Solanum commersonii]
MKKIVLEKENMQTNVSLPPFVDQVMKHSKQQKKFLSNYTTVGSSNPTKKLKVTLYNNQTVGTNSNLFSRHLGKIVRDRNIWSLGYHRDMILSKKS